ncbi:uncharacterized protein LOC120282197 [Dioscorea cayenensis subsp. rotundata]|uniref:Uncharacterized protein LOC120282197 n=1 Tax=Dioscorea cayennensis subsp. rotundata TaxID=55577 RepID=A0AB40CXU1_DIOCR|nr:uncharacterized protein LOC120282197 [Dioscorea cayenensis subsp. rotundata]
MGLVTVYICKTNITKPKWVFKNLSQCLLFPSFAGGSRTLAGADADIGIPVSLRNQRNANSRNPNMQATSGLRKKKKNVKKQKASDLDDRNGGQFINIWKNSEMGYA